MSPIRIQTCCSSGMTSPRLSPHHLPRPSQQDLPHDWSFSPPGFEGAANWQRYGSRAARIGYSPRHSVSLLLDFDSKG